MKITKITDFIFGYEVSKKSDNSSGGHIGKTFSDKHLSGIGAAYSKKFLKNPLAGFFDKLNAMLAHIYVRAYGTILISFGIMCAILSLSTYFLTKGSELPVSNLIIGAACLIISIPMLFIDMPLSAACASAKPISVFLFDFLCLKRVRSKTRTNRVVPFYLCIPIGALLALPTLFVPAYAVLLVAAVAIYLFLAINSPEFSFMITLLSIPAIPLFQHSSTVLVCLVAVTSASFLLKVSLGKRILHLEQYDFLIFGMAVLILLSGIFNKGFNSFENALLLIALLPGYTLSNNIIVNKRIADNAVNVIILSSIPAGIGGIVSYFLVPAKAGWLDPIFHGIINGRATSTFGNPNIFSVYLIIVIIFSMTYALDRSRGGARFFHFIASAINFAALALTFTRGAWLALLLSAAAYIILHFRNIPKVLLIPLALSPLSAFILPSEFRIRLLSVFNLKDTSISTRIEIWGNCLRMIRDRIFLGVGIGSASFKEEYKLYSFSDYIPEHSHNLFLELACQGGILLAVIFLFLLFTRLRHIAVYKPYIKGSSLTSPITMTGLVIFALICFGITDFIWYNSSMFFLFWVVFGIGSATLRIAKKEYEERLNYRGSESSSYSAVLDLPVRDD